MTFAVATMAFSFGLVRQRRGKARSSAEILLQKSYCKDQTVERSLSYP